MKTWKVCVLTAAALAVAAGFFQAPTTSNAGIVSSMGKNGPHTPQKPSKQELEMFFGGGGGYGKFIRLLYRGFLGREPSNDEVGFWRERMMKGVDRAGVAQQFLGSDEFFVRQVYLGVLGHEPDRAGLIYYTDLLKGGVRRDDVLGRIAYSPEFNNRLK